MAWGLFNFTNQAAACKQIAARDWALLHGRFWHSIAAQVATHSNGHASTKTLSGWYQQHAPTSNADRLTG